VLLETNPSALRASPLIKGARDEKPPAKGAAKKAVVKRKWIAEQGSGFIRAELAELGVFRGQQGVF